MLRNHIALYAGKSFLSRIEENSAKSLPLGAAGWWRICLAVRSEPGLLRETVAAIRAIDPRVKVSAAGGVNADNAAE